MMQFHISNRKDPVCSVLVLLQVFLNPYCFVYSVNEDNAIMTNILYHTANMTFFAQKCGQGLGVAGGQLAFRKLCFSSGIFQMYSVHHSILQQ